MASNNQKAFSASCQNVDLSWLEVSQLKGGLHGGLSSGVLSQALCPCGGSAGAWGWTGNALCSWGWCKQISSNLTIPEAYLNLGLTLVSKRKVLYLIRFYSQKKQLSPRLPSLCQSRRALSLCWAAPGTTGGVQVTGVTQEGLPNPGFPNDSLHREYGSIHINALILIPLLIMAPVGES